LYVKTVNCAICNKTAREPFRYDVPLYGFITAVCLI
jgi:hypothetical protein